MGIPSNMSISHHQTCNRSCTAAPRARAQWVPMLSQNVPTTTNQSMKGINWTSLNRNGRAHQIGQRRTHAISLKSCNTSLYSIQYTSNVLNWIAFTSSLAGWLNTPKKFSIGATPLPNYQSFCYVARMEGASNILIKKICLNLVAQAWKQHNSLCGSAHRLTAMANVHNPSMLWIVLCRKMSFKCNLKQQSTTTNWTGAHISALHKTIDRRRHIPFGMVENKTATQTQQPHKLATHEYNWKSARVIFIL